MCRSSLHSLCRRVSGCLQHVPSARMHLLPSRLFSAKEGPIGVCKLPSLTQQTLLATAKPAASGPGLSINPSSETQSISPKTVNATQKKTRLCWPDVVWPLSADVVMTVSTISKVITVEIITKLRQFSLWLSHASMRQHPLPDSTFFCTHIRGTGTVRNSW